MLYTMSCRPSQSFSSFEIFSSSPVQLIGHWKCTAQDLNFNILYLNLSLTMYKESTIGLRIQSSISYPRPRSQNCCCSVNLNHISQTGWHLSQVLCGPTVDLGPQYLKVHEGSLIIISMYPSLQIAVYFLCYFCMNNICITYRWISRASGGEFYNG